MISPGDLLTNIQIDLAVIKTQMDMISKLVFGMVGIVLIDFAWRLVEKVKPKHNDRTTHE